MNTISNLVGSEQPEWTLTIRPHQGWWDLHLGQLWRYRDLVMLFVWRDFVSVYKQTILGPIWYLLQPILTTLTFTIIFGNVAKLSTDGLPQVLFYMCNTVLWTYFSTSLTKTSTTFIANASIFGKVYFPRLAVPVSILISNLITFGIQFVLFLAFLAYFLARGATVAPNVAILLTPILVSMMAGFGLGAGIIISALTTRYRDLQHLVTFGVQLAMYLTPVVYPLSSTSGNYRLLLQANPLTSIMEAFRYAFLRQGQFSPYTLLYSAACMALVLIIGVLLFTRVERNFMDTV